MLTPDWKPVDMGAKRAYAGYEEVDVELEVEEEVKVEVEVEVE